MTDYDEFRDLMRRWKVSIVEFGENSGGIVIEPVYPDGSGLSGTEFIFNTDKSFNTIRIDIP